MERKTNNEYQNDTARLDNTRVVILNQIATQLTPELKLALEQRKLLEITERNKSFIYDADRAKYYLNMQNFYNNNFFGYGMFGHLTNLDPTNPEGQLAIQSNFDYAKSNVLNLAENVAFTGLASAASNTITKGSKLYSKIFKGPFRTPSKRGSLGTMSLYTKNGTLGSGAEAVVINNTPLTVGKMTTIPLFEMVARNAIPNTVLSKYIGFVKDKGVKLPTYILNKVRTLTEDTFPRYINKLDNAMSKSGFRRVTDPNVLYRAYTNGLVVVDDVAPGNVGLDWLGRPKMIDFNLLSVSDWVSLGFTLKDGGKLISKHLKGNKITPAYIGSESLFPDMLDSQSNKFGYYNEDNTFIPGITGYYKDNGQMILPLQRVNNEVNISLPNVEVTPKNIDLVKVIDEGRKEAASYLSPLVTGAGLGASGILMKTLPLGFVSGAISDLLDISRKKLTNYLNDNTSKISKRPIDNLSDYIVLDTYYPMHSKYTYTGHSELSMIDRKGDDRKSYNIDKSSRNEDYNLITNNCSDATKCALEKTFNKKLRPFLFTTPGDVLDFAIKELGGIPEVKGDSIFDLRTKRYKLNTLPDHFNRRGQSTVYIPITSSLRSVLKLYIELGNKNNLFKHGGKI